MNELKNHLLIGIAAASLLLGGCAVGTASFSSNAAAAELGQAENPEADAAEDEAEGPDTPITGDALEQASAAALAHLGEGTVTDTEVGDEEGYYEVEVTLSDGTEVDVHLDEAFNVLSTERDGAGGLLGGVKGLFGDDDDDDVPLTGETLEQATAAALAHLGEGTVTEAEMGDDDEGFYEVEVRLSDGSEVEVHLDERFNVIGTENEDDEDTRGVGSRND